MCLGLVSVPILVTSLGREAYGVWLLLGQLISYLALVDFGNASIAKLKLASTLDGDEVSEKQAVLTATLLGALVTTPLVLIVGLLVAWWASWRYADVGLPAFTVAASASLMVLSFLAMRLTSLPTFALFGANLEYRSAFSRLLITTANSVFDIAVAMSGFGMIGLAWNRLIAQIAIGFNLQQAAARYVPWYGYTRFDWSQLGPLLRQNSHCLFAQWGHTLVEAVDILVVGLAVGAEAVPVYTITSALPRLLFMLFNQAMSGANAGLVGLYGSGDKRQFHFVRTQQEMVTLGCFAVVGAITLAINGEFVGLWVGSGYFGGGVLTALAVLWYFAVITSRHYCNALSAALDFSRMARVQVAAGVVGLVAGIVGGRTAGISGAVLGLVIVRLATNLLNARRLDELLAVPTSDHVAALARPFATALCCCAAGWTVGRLSAPDSWLLTAGIATAVAAATGTAVWFIGLPPVAKDDLIARVGRLRDRLPWLRRTVIA